MKNRILKELEEYCKEKCEFYEKCKSELYGIGDVCDLMDFDMAACCRYGNVTTS